MINTEKLSCNPELPKYILQKTNMNKTGVSIILPCLNEQETIGISIKWAKSGLKEISRKYRTELIVVDNGSTDKSVSIAQKMGAKVIREGRRGYGRAYLTGIKKSRGEYIIIGDSDATYDFRQIPRFISKLESGSELVLGNRFFYKSSQKAIPFINRAIGNPILTKLINLFYKGNITDTQTGMRAFKKTAYNSLKMTSWGMEFASEMIIKSITQKLSVSEVPIFYYRRQTPSKLSPVRDAFRHIMSILLFSPTYVIIFPGIFMTCLGLVGTFGLMSGPVRIWTRLIDIHTLITSVFLMSLGTYTLLIGFFTRIYTVRKLGIFGGPLTVFLVSKVTVTRLFVTGLIIFLIAVIPLLITTITWIISGFSALAREREFIVATGFAVIGVQLIFASFLFKLLEEKS